MLIIGGFTSVPGAICGGLIIGLGEKIFEIYWGPMMGGSVEGWFAYVIALIFLLSKKTQNRVAYDIAVNSL